MRVRFLPKTFEQRLRQDAEERAEAERRREEAQTFLQPLPAPVVRVRLLRARR